MSAPRCKVSGCDREPDGGAFCEECQEVRDMESEWRQEHEADVRLRDELGIR